MRALATVNGKLEVIQTELRELNDECRSARVTLMRAESGADIDESMLAQAQQVIDRVEALESKGVVLQKVAALLTMIDGCRAQLSDFDELGEIVIEAAQDITSDGLEPIGELLNKVLPAFGGILGTTIKTLEPAMIDFLNFNLNELVTIGEGIQEAQQRLYRLRASNRLNLLTAYTDAGFSREEALALVLNDSSKSSVTTLQMIDGMSKSVQQAVSSGKSSG